MAATARSDRVTPEQIERARGVDLIAFLRQYEPGELKRVGDMTTLRVDGKIIYLKKDAFPSLKPEQSIKLSELADLSL